MTAPNATQLNFTALV